MCTYFLDYLLSTFNMVAMRDLFILCCSDSECQLDWTEEMPRRSIKCIRGVPVRAFPGVWVRKQKQILWGHLAPSNILGSQKEQNRPEWEAGSCSNSSFLSWWVSITIPCGPQTPSSSALESKLPQSAVLQGLSHLWPYLGLHHWARMGQCRWSMWDILTFVTM